MAAQVIVAENDRGQSVLSIRKSLLEKRWTTLADVQKNGEAVDVTLRDPVRGVCSSITAGYAAIFR